MKSGGPYNLAIRELINLWNQNKKETPTRVSCRSVVLFKESSPSMLVYHFEVVLIKPF